MYNIEYNIGNAAILKSYEYLNSLTPLKRFAEMLRLETELLDFEIHPEDEILGIFKLDEAAEPCKPFVGSEMNEADRAVATLPNKFGADTTVDFGHTIADYETVLNRGLIYYENKINSELERFPQNEYLLSMRDTVSVIKAFTVRLCDEAEKRAETDFENREKLLKFKSMLERVPYYPADNFHEAVQSLWIIHFIIPMAENSWASISLGKFDKYMYPFYKRSLSNGCSRQELKAVLCNLYRLLNTYCDGACLLNVGIEYNELSMLIIECQREMAMPAPILGAVVDEATPDSVWNALIDEELFLRGQPTFYGKESCISALTEKGLDRQEAEHFSNNSCMGIAIAGNEFNSMWGCSFKIPAVLEAAVNGGKLITLDSDFCVPNIIKPDSCETLFANFESCAEYMLNICAKAYEKKAEWAEKNRPDSFISLLTEGCIEKHCDRISGAKYHNITVECFGMINAADGICAVDTLVFKEKRYTLEDMCLAVKNNFAGFEALRRDILRCGRFGENSPADEYAVRVAEIMQRAIRQHNRGNKYYSPSLHTLDNNVYQGLGWGAGFDGRLSGEAFAKNAGPSNRARRAEPTSMLLSSAGLPQHKFFGGQPIDVNFQTDTVKNHKAAVKALISVYLQSGGLQLQVNSLSSELLRDAMENPEKYPNLVVRIGGYSLYFNSIG